MFLIHEILLASYIISLLVYVILYQLYNSSSQKKTGLATITIVFQVASLLQAASFWLVLYILVPFTKSQRERLLKMHTFILNGFIDFDQLLNAIYA